MIAPGADMFVLEESFSSSEFFEDCLLCRRLCLTADACSLSLQAGDESFKALELLELGRGVIMGLLIDDRSDISRLEHPEMK
jgi:hypothetical protein